MAVIAFPSVVPTSIDIKQNASVSTLRSPYAPNAVQVISRGVAWWTGSIRWGSGVWDQDVDKRLRLDDVQSFIDGLEFGLHSFDIPLNLLMKGRDVRFPSKDETTADNSVRITAVAPTATASSQIGLTAKVTLDVPVGQYTYPSGHPREGQTIQTGLKRGDWISLAPNIDSPIAHRGAYRCRSDQVGNEVLVTPAPPTPLSAADGHRVYVRNPTLRARLAAEPPSVAYRGEFFEPLIIQWEQARA